MHTVKRRLVKALDRAFSNLIHHIGVDVSKDNAGFLNLTAGHFEINVGLSGDYIYVCDYAVGKGYIFRYDYGCVTLITTGKDYELDQMPVRVLRQLQKGITIALATLPKFDTPELLELRRQYYQTSFDRMACNSVWGGMGTASAVSTLFQPGITALASIATDTLVESVTSADALDSVADLPLEELTPTDDATEHLQRLLDKRRANKQAMVTNRTAVSVAQREFYKQWLIDTGIEVTYPENYSKGYAEAMDTFVTELVR